MHSQVDTDALAGDLEKRRFKPVTDSSDLESKPESSQVEVSRHKVDQEEHEKAKKFIGELDKKNIPFDPERHHFSSIKGFPPKHPQYGTWYRKGAFDHLKKKKPSNAFVFSPEKEKAAQVEKEAEGIRESESLRMGSVAAQMTVQFGCMIGGDEWTPQTVNGLNEMDILSTAYGNYFIANDYEDLPPGAALCIAVMGYALPRLSQPKTVSFFGRCSNWIKSKVLAFRMWRSSPQGEPETIKESGI
jgi:hypothetical protein